MEHFWVKYDLHLESKMVQRIKIKEIFEFIFMTKMLFLLVVIMHLLLRKQGICFFV